MNIDSNIMLPCVNKQILGFECSGCGIQRAFYLLIDGEFINAFYMYPAIYTLIVFATIVVVSLFYKFKYSNKIISILAIINILIILFNFIYKLIN